MPDVGTRTAVVDRLEPFRGELTAYCYRMLGSSSEAEDATQETLVRAWRGHDDFEGRSALRTWLYRIATNVCIDMLRSTQRRARPIDLNPSSPATATLAAPLPESAWLEPMPDGRLGLDASDPGELAASRDTVRLAFVAALQHLPPRGRAALLLCDVLRFPAAEVASLLDTSVASVNSALQRARATLADRAPTDVDAYDPLDEAQRLLLSRFVDAFERYDLDDLTALMTEDVIQSMPPLELWVRGQDQLRDWYLGTGIACRGSRLVPTVANGQPAFGQYKPSGPGGRHEPWALIVLELVDGRIGHVCSFLDTPHLFPVFGLPAHPDDDEPMAPAAVRVPFSLPDHAADAAHTP